MSVRLWYPQLDVYDAIRRIGCLLSLWSVEDPPSPERMFIADFYLANPPLLHKTNMTADTRKKFNDMGIVRPENTFLSYPSAPILFQKMDEVQRQAFRTLTAKGLVELSKLDQGEIVPSFTGTRLFGERFVPLLPDSERCVAEFLCNSFASSSTDIVLLRRRTGLRRLVQ